MTKYLRFGQIPISGKSVNFFKLTNEQNENFTHLCNSGAIAEAFAELPENAFEAGISAFEMDANGMPALNNIQLVKALLARLNEQIYEISGERAEVGNSGEPLIVGAKIEKRREINKAKLLDHALACLLQNFRSAQYNAADDHGSNQVLEFYQEYKANKKTGEKVSVYEQAQGDDWVKLPPIKEYTFNGWTFADPIDGFCE